MNKYEGIYKGPYEITNVYTNGTLTIRWGTMQEGINIIWIKPNQG